MSCFMFFMLIFSVSALTDIEVDVVSELVSSSGEEEFLLFVGLADENELDLRAEAELSGLVIEKAEYFDVELSRYGRLKLYNNFFSRFSWFFSNYITGFVISYIYEVGCVPDCSGKECGDDGCGESCGYCKVGDVCDKDKCVKKCPSTNEEVCEGDNVLILTYECGELVDKKIKETCGKSFDCKNAKCVVIDDSGNGGWSDNEGTSTQKEAKEDSSIEKVKELKTCVDCYKENLWLGLCEGGVMIKPTFIKEKCKIGCKEGKCVGPVLSTLPGESVEQKIDGKLESPLVVKIQEDIEKKLKEKEKQKQAEIKEEITEKLKSSTKKKKDKGGDGAEVKLLNTKPPTLSVRDLNKKMKRMVSAKCVPNCNELCGQLDSCGGFCLDGDIDTLGKCGNEPKEEELTYIQKATSQVSDTVGGKWLNWLLVENP